ncbi:TonB-dependent receptor [uncultured Actinobacillus sp.]|uniref:TonB-dependent receptor plug domain-containing protein n=1 Tax=uncultured Actinobacillus sp. TaxID=417616 RepID=UPI0025FB568A|nr:TonB-dependent receptor [uncultured Actinobacillus sp.]
MKLNKISLILCAVCPAASLAETATLPDIKVYSAYATPVNQDKTASSVTVLTEKDFTERNATYVSDVLKTVPSVAMSASGGRGTLTNFYLRGADANHTAVVIDGVKVNPITGYGFDFGGLSLSNIDRIEVLRGEQSTLWGSDAMGGVIYITTKSGLYKNKPFNVDFDLGTGSHGTYDGSATISGYNNGFYYALNGNSHRTRGISAISSDKFNYTAEDGTFVPTGGAKERDKFHRDNVSFRLGYDLNNKGVELLATHSTQNSHYDDYPTEGTYDNYTHTRETLLKLSGYLGSDQELFKHKFAVSNIKTDSNSYEAYSTSAYGGKRLAANYQLDVNFDREGEITQGLSFLTEYQKSDYQANYNSPAFPDWSYDLDNKKLIEKSIATEYRLLSEQDHSFSISGRFTDNSEYENAFTGRIAGAYRLSPNIKAHASLGSAIQNPTMTEYYGYNGKFIANPALKPEKSRGGDIGLLLESQDKQHSFDVTYFARNVDNMISTTRINGNTKSINLDGISQIRGVELAYNGKITDLLTTYANYTYTQARDSQKMELVRRPKHLANAGIAYQITSELGADINVSYVGKRFEKYTYYDANFNSTSTRVKLPSYTLVNLGVNYQVTPNINVYANLNNVFDKKYEDTLYYGQDGRNVYVGLKGSF